MCTNTLSYLHFKLQFKSILLAVAAVFFMTACGIKGDLYQTPKQADTAEATETTQDDKSISEQVTIPLIDEGKEQQ